MAGISKNMRGAALMVAAMIAFTVNDAFVKVLAGEVPLFQVVFVRGLATCILLTIFAWFSGAFSCRVRLKDWIIIGLRAASEVAAAIMFITALFHMPIASVSAILQALPLAVTLAGALFLGEAIGWRRMAAILVGFLGVLLIIRPGTSSFDAYSIYPVLVVVVVTFRDLSARRLSSNVPSMTVALATAVIVTVCAGIGLLGGEWVSLNTHSYSLLGLAAIFVVGGYLFSVMTMRTGEISFIAPFRYTSLLVAMALGFFVFDEWPDTWTLIGSGIVVATGAFTLYREHRSARAKRLVPLRSR
ncbi:MAG: DMT family transporter [Marinosulfonomonas sp.]|nr:DMT family transporter [Marinosulfonomonas sp.]